jgi:hypothetical protein
VIRRPKAVVVVVLLGLAALSLIGFAVFRDDDAGGTTQRRPPVATSTTGRGSASSSSTTTPTDPRIVTIAVPAELRTIVDDLTAAFRLTEPETRFQIDVAPSLELFGEINSGSRRPNLYIDDTALIAQLDDARLGAPPTKFGDNLLQIILQKNGRAPFHGLQMFGDDPSSISGLCAPEARCGDLAKRVLASAGITPAPDRYRESGESLVADTLTGDLDAVLAMRTDGRLAMFRVRVAQVDPAHNIKVQYDIVPIRRSDAADRFAEYVRTSETAERLLKRFGLIPLIGPESNR